MVAIPALYPGKAVVQVAALQVAVNDLPKVGPPETVPPFETFLINLNKGLKMVFHAPVIIGRLGIPGTVNGGVSRQHAGIGRIWGCMLAPLIYSSFDELSRKIFTPVQVDPRSVLSFRP